MAHTWWSFASPSGRIDTCTSITDSNLNSRFGGKLQNSKTYSQVDVERVRVVVAQVRQRRRVLQQILFRKKQKAAHHHVKCTQFWFLGNDRNLRRTLTCTMLSTTNGRSASMDTTHGEIVVPKDLARNGPSGTYSHFWMSRAAK